MEGGIYRSQSYLGQLRERGDVVLGVADALYVDRLRLLVDRGSESLGLWAVHELGADVEALQEHCNESELHMIDLCHTMPTFELVVGLFMQSYISIVLTRQPPYALTPPYK